MKLLVCGGRDFNDVDRVYNELDALNRIFNIKLVIEGGARGADRLGRKWARDRAIACRTFEADWTKHGPSAGPTRNKQMLEEGKPDLVVAFPGGKGTANMVKQAKEAGVNVVKLCLKI